MPTVEVTLPQHAYDVVIDSGLLKSVGSLVRELNSHAAAAVFLDENIEQTHGRVAVRSMTAAEFDTVVGIMPTGEDRKNLGTVRGLYDVMLNARLERKSPVVAVGGGITGDTVGFVAATYLRGVPFVQVPTTLLSMVDASVGGKVGINMPQGKNLVGAFHQPDRVIIDVDTLLTLPERELRCGFAECVKHGVIRDEALFDWTVANASKLTAQNSDALIELVQRNVRIKADVVMRDEKEAGERAHLNFGHTFAHAIEKAAAYGDHLDIKHGEAVALGMVAATRLAVEQKLCDQSVLGRLIEALETVGLPSRTTQLPADDQMMLHMRLDKKVKDGKIRLVLPTRIGEVIVTDEIPDDAIRRAWLSLKH